MYQNPLQYVTIKIIIFKITFIALLKHEGKESEVAHAVA
jgi:hypothetical protein